MRDRLRAILTCLEIAAVVVGSKATYLRGDVSRRSGRHGRRLVGGRKSRLCCWLFCGFEGGRETWPVGRRGWLGWRWWNDATG
jgi:hypothetical protein